MKEALFEALLVIPLGFEPRILAGLILRQQSYLSET